MTRLVFLGERSRACDGSNPFTCKWSSRDVIPSDSFHFSLKWHQYVAAVRSVSRSARWNYLVLKVHIGAENAKRGAFYLCCWEESWCKYIVLSTRGKKKMGGWHERRCLTFCYSDRWGAFSTPGASLICSVAARPDKSCSSLVWMWSRPAKSPKASTAPAEKPHLVNNRQKQIWFTEATMIVITVHLSIRKSRSSVL